MQLQPYGLQITLKKGLQLDPLLQQKNIQVGYFSKHRGLFVLPSGRYSLGAFLGSGSYATIYTGIHEITNTAYSMKLINMKNVSFASVIRECIVHILLDVESSTQPDGPYVPRFYEVAYDSYNDVMILRTETIQDILYDRYRAGTAYENDTIIPNTTAQIAQILDFFYKRLEFNHRDLKPNNILYNYDPLSGRIAIKLIDFGYSCLCWNGIDINAGDRITGACFRKSRDMTQYLYATYTDPSIPMSESLQTTLREALEFPVDGKLCRMWDGCRAFGETLEVWAHTYRFMNDARIENPHGTPTAVHRRMLEYLGLTTKAKTPLPTIAGLPHCVAERVLNPKTRRCITRGSAEGRKVLRLSKRYSTPSPKTLRQYRNSLRLRQHQRLR